MARVQDEFRDKGILQGRTLIFRPADAIALVGRCRERRIVVLGIDGFHVSGESHQPDQDESVDLSWPHLKREDQCWERAEAFLSERLGRDLFFEVVVREQ